MKYIAFAFLLLLPSLSFASEEQKAQEFIKSLGDQVIHILEQTKQNSNDRRQKFSTILNKNFDMDVIARFSMGRYWAIATDSEKSEYKRLFRKMVVDVYTSRFSEYSGQTLDVNGSKAAGRKDMIVNSVIKGNGQPIKVDWRLRKGRIIDVLVEGVSMSVTQRSEFASIIQRNGGKISALIDHLKK